MIPQLTPEQKNRFDHEWQRSVNGGEYPSDKFEMYMASEIEVARTNALIEAYQIVGNEKNPGYPEGKFNISQFKRAVRKKIRKVLTPSQNDKE